MHVRLTILDGSMSGRSFEFDLPEGEEVRLGRDPVRCRLAFSPDYATVSRQHCALRSVLGRVRIRTNKENVVLLGDRPAWDDTLLTDGSILQLGRSGPRLAVAVDYPEATTRLASTVAFSLDGAAPEIELQKNAERVEGELRTHRRRAWFVRGGLATVAIGGAWLAFLARAEAAHLQKAVLDDEQKRVVLEMIARDARPAPGMAETAASVADSVYCVMKRGDGGDRPVGTAWVVDRDAGLLATNAHVAKEFDEGETFVRSNGRAFDDIDVVATRIHPDYDEFGEQLDRYCQALEMSGADSTARAMRGYDVALLVVGETDRPRLAPGLEILTAVEAAGVGPGAPCAMVGFPAEGIGFNPQRPQHKTHLGHVVAATDWFMAASRPEYALLVHTSLPVAGGASGSPLVDERGRVIGLISSANVVHSAEGRRIPLAGTTCAQRIDMLHELLLGSAGDGARQAIWAANFEAAVANAKKSMEQILVESFELALQGRGAAGHVEVMSRDPVRLEWDPETGLTIKTIEVTAPAAGSYLCCIIADDVMDIDATVFLPDGSSKQDLAPDWFPSVAFDVDQGAVVRIAAFRDGNEPTGATVLVLRQAP